MTSRIFIAPQRYVQGPGELDRFGEHVARLGTKPLVVALAPDFDRVADTITASAERSGHQLAVAEFGGELTRAEANRLRAAAEAEGSDVIVGLGGGKACDAAKAVAEVLNLPCVTVPTVASTDAPCSALAVFYTEEGAFESGDLLRRNPDLVLVDSQVIAQAPTRFLISGFGDAFATYFEARAVQRSGATNMPGGTPTTAALAIAEACVGVLRRRSLEAISASDTNTVNDALEDVIEANVLLSGIGFESGGLAVAHSIHNALTELEQTHGLLHGEKVAFGILVQLVLEESDEFAAAFDYLRSVGLPTTLADLGLPPNEATLRSLAFAAVAPGETLHNMPISIDEDAVLHAVIEADRRASEMRFS